MSAEPNQAFHLIEQFSTQAPFAIWIIDAHGRTVFANSKLRETLQAMHYMHEPLGLNLFHGQDCANLGLSEVCRRLVEGRVVNEAVETGDYSLHIVAYPLFSNDGQPDNHVIIINDVTPSRLAQEKLRKKLHDVATLQKAKQNREDRVSELLAEIHRLEKEIRSFGGQP